MKKVLLASAAVIAVAATSGAASAASNFEVRMGGDAWFSAGVISQKRDNGLRSTEFEDRFRLNIVATGKTDTGLEYGGRIRLRTSPGNGGVDNDRAYIFVGGSFGTFQMGTQNGVSDEYGVIGPVVDWGTYGGPDGFWLDYLAGSSTAGELPTGAAGALRTLNSSTAASRITYVSPEFSGLKLAASYATNMSSSGQNVNRVTNNGTRQDVYEIGAIYSRTFGDFGVDATLFYEGGDVESAATEDLSSWAAGLMFTYQAFKFGGSYTNAGDSGYASGAAFKDDQETYIIAAQYDFGPVLVGASYTRSEDAGNAAVAGDRKLDLWQAGFSVPVAPGLTFSGEYSHFDLDTDTANADDKGDIFVLQTTVTF